jgi:hypothetical protein
MLQRKSISPIAVLIKGIERLTIRIAETTVIQFSDAAAATPAAQCAGHVHQGYAYGVELGTTKSAQPGMPQW